MTDRALGLGMALLGGYLAFRSEYAELVLVGITLPAIGCVLVLRSYGLTGGGGDGGLVPDDYAIDGNDFGGGDCGGC